MGLFGRIGQRIGSGLRIGGRMVSGFSSLGQRVSGAVQRGMDAIERIPVVGGIIAGSPPMQGLRGITSGMRSASNLGVQAGQIMTKAGNMLPGASMNVYGGGGNTGGPR